MLSPVAWVAVPLTLLAALVVLTALGARRRGNPWVLAVPAGVVFPITWVWWYVSDELPQRRARKA